MIFEIVIIIILLLFLFALANVLAFVMAAVHLFLREKDLTRKAIWFSILLTTGLAGALGYLLTRIYNSRKRKRDPGSATTFEDEVIRRLLKKDRKERTSRMDDSV